MYTIRVDLNHFDLLFLVGSGLVVQHSIPVETDSKLFTLLGQSKQLLLGTPLGSRRSLLIKFAQVVEIVDVVAVTLQMSALIED